MIHPFQRAHIMAIQHDLPPQFVPVMLNLIVLHHNDDKVHIIQELIEVKELVLDNLLMDERIIDFQRTGEMPLLGLK